MARKKRAAKTEVVPVKPPEPKVEAKETLCRDCVNWDPASEMKGARQCQLRGNMTAHNSTCPDSEQV